MTLKDIAVFKHFIANNDLRQKFINIYKGSKEFAKLPNDIENYFMIVDPLAVITKAVRVVRPNATYGYDFWQGINEDWKLAYKKAQASDSYEKEEGLTELNGYYRILRENWNDSKKPWRYETEEQTRIRLCMEPIKKNNVREELAEILSKELEGTESNYDEIEIEFVEFDSASRQQHTLPKGSMSVNTRNHSWRATINRIDTKDIKRKELSRAMVGKTKSGDIVIQFNNNQKGIPVVYTSDKYININNQQLVGNLRTLLVIPDKDDLIYLNIENISEKQDSITYKVTKQ